jgi:hypothetical protein
LPLILIVHFLVLFVDKPEKEKGLGLVDWEVAVYILALFVGNRIGGEQ